MQSPLPPTGKALDRTIRRNTLTLAAGLAIACTIIQLQAALATITTEGLTGQTAQAGVASALFSLTLGLVAIPAGRIMDRIGRGPVLAAGFVVAALASAALYVAVSTGSLELFLIAMAALGVGLGAASLARVGAADMAPPERRGTIIGRVLLGAAVGAILGPILFAPLLSGETASVASLSAPWILAAFIAVLGAAVVLSIRQDPLAIARELGQPDGAVPAAAALPGAEASSERPSGSVARPRGIARRSLATIVRQPGVAGAFGGVIVAQGVMAIAMSVVGLEMHHHGEDLGAISVALAVHIVGMFGLSPLLGRAVDRFGRQMGLVVGLAVCGAGAAGLAIGASLGTVLPSIFLVGAGWSLASLAGTARVADATMAEERGASLGALDMAALFTSAAMTLLGPAFLSVSDLAPLMVAAALVAVLPAAYLAIRPRLAPAT